MRVLIADDNEAEAEVLKKLLKKRFDAEVFITNSMAATKEVIAANNLDCVCLDLNFPDSEIENTIREIAKLPYPVFVYTGFDDPGLRERVLKAGAEDFITKSTGKGDIVQRIGHLQYKRHPDPRLLQGAYRAAHDKQHEETRAEWRGTIPRVAAAVVSVIMFVAGLFTGTWALGKIFGENGEQTKQHFAKLDSAIIELADAGRARDNLLKDLNEKALRSIDDRQSIREQMKGQNDLVIDWLKRIESKIEKR